MKGNDQHIRINVNESNKIYKCQTRYRQIRVTSKSSFILVVFLVLLTSCATEPPVPLRVNLPSNPTVSQVLQAPDNYVGTKVRWGGVINKITNLKSTTEIEIISRELDKQARPASGDKTYGRFIARIPGFLEPSIFSPNREITVVGTISGTMTQPIGDYEYTYPVVDVETYHLWEPRAEQQPYYYGNWMYDPWYWGYPWYPWWYPYPY